MVNIFMGYTNILGADVSISNDSGATPATPLPLRQLLLGCCPAVHAIQTAEEEAAAAMETWSGNGAKEQGR